MPIATESEESEMMLIVQPRTNIKKNAMISEKGIVNTMTSEARIVLKKTNVVSVTKRPPHISVSVTLRSDWRMKSLEFIRFTIRMSCGMNAIYSSTAFSTESQTAKVLAPERFCITKITLCLPFAPESLDLIVSGLAWQLINDIPGVLAQARRARYAARKRVNQVALGLSLAAMAFGVFWLVWILWETLRLGLGGLSLPALASTATAGEDNRSGGVTR